MSFRAGQDVVCVIDFGPAARRWEAVTGDRPFVPRRGAVYRVAETPELFGEPWLGLDGASRRTLYAARGFQMAARSHLLDESLPPSRADPFYLSTGWRLRGLFSGLARREPLLLLHRPSSIWDKVDA